MSTTATKTINKDVVYHAAMLLIQSNGKTSSLEVKEHLRSMGFWAKQSTVSSIMQGLQSEHSWTKNDNSGHLEYTIPSTNTAFSAGTTTTGKSQLAKELIELIIDSVGLDEEEEDIELSSILSVDLGIDHLDLIKIGVDIDNKYNIQSRKENWKNVNKIEDVVNLVERLSPSQTPTASTLPVSNNTGSGSNAGPTKQRKPRTVINDSINASTSARVTINIDPKGTPHQHGLAQFGPFVGNTGLAALIDLKNKYGTKDWFVSNKGSNAVIYDEKYTSDNVRSAYARLMGIKIQDVRAKRVAHL